MTNLDELILELYKIGVFKIGNFILKSGDKSPYYLDLRLVPSHPKLFKDINKIYLNLIRNLKYQPDSIAGIISAGIPFATAICVELNLPLLQIRKEQKSYGKQKLIEGSINSGDKVVIIDDLISTGASKIPAIKALRDEDLIVDDIIVLVDRRKRSEVRSLFNTSIHAAFTPWDIANSLKNNQGIELPEDHHRKLVDILKKWDE